MNPVLFLLAGVHLWPEFLDALTNLGQAHGNLPITLPVCLEILLEKLQFRTVLTKRFPSFAQSLLGLQLTALVVGDLPLASGNFSTDFFPQRYPIG